MKATVQWVQDVMFVGESGTGTLHVCDAGNGGVAYDATDV